MRISQILCHLTSDVKLPNYCLLKKLINGAVTLEIYSTFYHNNCGNCNFIAESQCDRYIFYVNESIHFCMISGETLPLNAVNKRAFPCNFAKFLGDRHFAVGPPKSLRLSTMFSFQDSFLKQLILTLLLFPSAFYSGDPCKNH